MKVCYVFPGQGSQSVGMGKSIYNKYHSCREIFHLGNKILGFDITDLMFNGPNEALTKTTNCQPAIFLSNMAYFSVLKYDFPCSLSLGHSIGEYSALVASNALSLEDGIRLVSIRAKLMKDYTPSENVKENTSHMAAIITDNQDLVYNACKECSLPNSIVQVANLNSPSQIVISGNNSAVIRAVEYLKNNNIEKIIYLHVEGPFHSELMKPASEALKKELESITINPPLIPYIANFSADFVYEPEQIKLMLINQIAGTVKWKQSLEKAIQSFNTFIESGPGNIQTNMLKRDYKGIEVLDKDKFIQTKSLSEVLK